MSDPAFWERGHAVAPDFLSKAQLAFVRAAMDASVRNNGKRIATRVAPQVTLNEYSPIAGEAVLLQCRPAIEALVGRELIPAYAYWRIYEHGAQLLRHIDRGACEVSVTLPIFSLPADSAWPIWVGGLDGVEAAVAVLPGAGVVYQGCRVPHWRETFTGECQYQLFLHYVLADGDNAALAFDGRAGLNLHFRDAEG